MTTKPTPAPKNAETIVRDVETAPDALMHLKEQMEKQKMNKEQLEELHGAVEKSNTLKEKAKLMEEIQKKMDDRAAEDLLTEKPAAAPLSPEQAHIMPQKEETFMNGLKDISGTVVDTVLPKRITDRMSPERKVAVLAAATLGIGVLAYFLFFRGKKGVEAGEEAAKETSGGWFKKFLVGIGIGAAVFLGYKGYKMFGKYQEQMDAMEKIQEKARQEIANMQRKLKETRDAAARAAGKAREELERKARELEEKINNKKNELPEDEAKETKEEEKESAPEGPRQNMKNMIASAAIVIFDKNADTWSLGQKAKIAQVQDVINTYSPGEKHGDTKMKDILDPNFVFEIEDREKAALLLRSFIDNHYENVLALIMEREDISEEEAQEKIENMDLQTYLKLAAASFGGIVDIMQTMNESTGTIVEKLGNLNLEKMEGIDVALREQLAHILEKELKLSSEEMEDFSYVAFFKVFASKIGGTARHATLVTDGSIEEKAASRILENLKNGDVHKYMLPCFHGILPVDNEMKNKNDLEKVQSCLLDRMPITQSLRCYFYAQMMKDGNPAGLALMQTEVLKFIQDSEVNVWDKMNKYDVLHNIVEKIATQTSKEITEEWKKLDVKIDENMVERGVSIMSNVFQFGAKKGADAMTDSSLESAMFGLSTIKKYPKMSALAGGTLAAVGWRYYHKGSLPSNIDEALRALSKPIQGADVIDKISNRVRHITLSSENIDAAATAYKRIYQSLEKLPTGPEKEALFKVLRSCNNSNATELPWRNFAELLKKTPAFAGSETEKAALLFAENPGMRRVINYVRHPLIRKTLLGLPMIRITRGAANVTYETGKSAVQKIGKLPEAARAIKNSAVVQKGLNVGKKALPTAAKTFGTLRKMPGVARFIKPVPILGAVGVGAEAYNFFTNEQPRLLKAYEEETDPMKKAMIERQLHSQRMGLAFNTLALPAAASPAGLALILGNEARRFAEESIDEGTMYMLSSEKDLLKYSSGNILWHIGRSSPIKNVSWGQSVAGIGMSETFRDANEAARHDGYRAYFRQMALQTLPALTVLDLPPDERSMDKAARSKQLEIRTKEELGTFASYAMKFIKNETNGAYTSLTPPSLRLAQLYAKEKTLERRGELSQPESALKPVEEKQWSEERRILKETEKNYENVQMETIASLAEDPGIFEQAGVAQMILEIQHELSVCESRILDTNFSDWTTFASWRHWENDESMRATARGVYAEKVRDVLRDVTQKVMNGDKITSADIQKAITKMRTELTSGNPDAIALKTINASNVDHYRKIGEADNRLSLAGMFDLLQQYPLAA